MNDDERNPHGLERLEVSVDAQQEGTNYFTSGKQRVCFYSLNNNALTAVTAGFRTAAHVGCAGSDAHEESVIQDLAPHLNRCACLNMFLVLFFHE